MLTVMEFNRNKQNEIQLKCKEKYIYALKQDLQRIA